MPNRSFTVVSLFKLILMCAVLSLVARPVVAGVLQEEIDIFAVLGCQLVFSLAGIISGAILGLTRFHQRSGVVGGALCGCVIGFFLGNIAITAGQGETAVTMIILSVITVVYGMLKSAAELEERRRQLETERPPTERFG